MTAPTDLIERLEGASVGSRELDAAVWRALEPEQVDSICGFRGMVYAGTRYDKASKAAYIRQVATIRAPEFTTSLDAALALAERVLPGWGFFLHSSGDGYEAAMTDPVLVRFTPFRAITQNSLSLALCIATLRASEQSK